MPDAAPELVHVDPAAVAVSERLRLVDEAWVEAIAASIEQKGQDTPIQVRRNGGGKLHLVAGAHRLAACKRLGVEVRAEIIQCSALEARLIEIDENLFRRELNALDRAVFLAERKKVYEEMYPETKRGVAGGKARQSSATEIISFAESTAVRVGLTDRSIRLAISIAERIPADVRARLAGTKIAEKQADLLSLANLEPKLQRKAIALIEKGTAPTLKAAMAKVTGSEEPEGTPEDRQYARLYEAWARAGAGARSLFIAHLHETGELGAE